MTTPQTFRKKPVEVQAMHWDGRESSAAPIIEWIRASGGTATYTSPQPPHRKEAGMALEPPSLDVWTLEGVIRYPPHYVVIRGVQGEFYACEAEIFAATYDAV